MPLGGKGGGEENSNCVLRSQEPSHDPRAKERGIFTTGTRACRGGNRVSQAEDMRVRAGRRKASTELCWADSLPNGG